MNNKTDIIIKIGLSIFLILCLTDMPYGYFQFVRFISLIGFAVLAYHANQQDKHTEVIIYVVLALLFQPFLKISFGRTLWNIVDLVVAIGLIMTIFNSDNIEKKKQ